MRIRKKTQAVRRHSQGVWTAIRGRPVTRLNITILYSDEIAERTFVLQSIPYFHYFRSLFLFLFSFFSFPFLFPFFPFSPLIFIYFTYFLVLLLPRARLVASGQAIVKLKSVKSNSEAKECEESIRLGDYSEG
jgi:hypothetical protein